MTGIVLALAGLTCGDGGPGAGGATAPVAAGISGEWEGRWASNHGATYAADLRGGVLRVYSPDRSTRFTLRVIGEGRGRVRMTDPRRDDWMWFGVYKVEGPCLILCSGARLGDPRPAWFRVGTDSDLFTLRPAAPRKP